MKKLPAISPRWLIFALDISLSSSAFLVAHWITGSYAFRDFFNLYFLQVLLLLISVNALLFYQLRLYSGIVRYTGGYELGRLLLAGLLSTLIFSGLNAVLELFESQNVSVFWAMYFANFVLLLGAYRTGIKYVHLHFANMGKPRQRVVIYGAGDLGAITKMAIDQNPGSPFSVVAFIDDDPKKAKQRLDGMPILSLSDFKSLHARKPVDALIISVLNFPPEKKGSIIDYCLNHRIQALKVPPLDVWPKKIFQLSQLQKVRIEDLLDREPIRLDKPELSGHFAGKRVLVTGAAGSIGSELVHQILALKPTSIVVCDQAETPLHELLLKLEPLQGAVDIKPYLASVTDEVRMHQLFRKFRPDYVFHAAAYKHVPMMEAFPTEAIRVNVCGTRLLADLAVRWNVQRFVMVSSDKAVNPSNIMGASKRLAEIYVQGLAQQNNHSTRFMTTRFGNVLGSNGSVIHRFKSQIEAGGPVTVTHPKITRYFMTIPEACQLVLEAGSMGKGGELFVFDMGNSVPIADLARKMIRLYGLEPGVDIHIEYTGLRPGEKLYEELLNDRELNLETYHEKILIAKVRPVEHAEVIQKFKALEMLLQQGVSENHLVKRMKEMIPEFVSNNSTFEALDKLNQAS